MLPENFKEPTGFKWGTFKDKEGAEIRYGSLQRDVPPPKGTIVIVTGFREMVEKYFEVIKEMADQGYNVWIMDWRGQGGSERFLKKNPQKMFSKGYELNIETLHQFTDKIVKKSEGPLVLLGHSMGAHIGLRYLKEHEGVFDSAIFTAPMFEIFTHGLPRPVARQIARFAKAGNYLEKYIPRGGDWDESNEVFDKNNKTSDPERFKVMKELFLSKPELKMGEPTYGWLYHTFKSIDIINDEEYLKAIKTPILMEISGKDSIVDESAEKRAAKLLANCKTVTIADARHEIWMERDELRSQWLAKVGDFLEEQLKKHAPTPKKPKQNSVHRPPKLG